MACGGRGIHVDRLRLVMGERLAEGAALARRFARATDIVPERMQALSLMFASVFDQARRTSAWASRTQEWLAAGARRGRERKAAEAREMFRRIDGSVPPF
ncbi:MAG: hypothetical protein ACM3OO_01810 [Planctomycetaceae bacterium]